MLSVVKIQSSLFSILFLLVLVSSPGFGGPRKIHKKNIDDPGGAGLTNEIGNWVTGYYDETAIDQQRNLAFLSTGGKVLIFDVSDVSSPVLLNESIIGAGIINNMFYDSTTQHLYLAEGYHGIEIWDVSNINSPQKLSGMALYYYGDVVYAAEVKAKPGFLFVTEGYAGLETFDISDPTNPVELSRSTYLDTYGYMDINDAGDVIVASGSDGTASFSIQPNGALNFISGNTFYEMIGGSGITINGDYVYQVSEGYLYIMNVYVITGAISYHLPGTPTYDYSISISGNTLYLADAFYGVEIYDISSPYNPVYEGSYQSYCRDIQYFPDHVLFSNVTGMKILDVTDPTSPVLNSEYSGVGGYAGYGMKVIGNYCFNPLGRGLHILDVTNPSAPVLASINEPSSGSDFAAAYNGNYAYITNSQNGFRVVDISDPTNPVTVGNSTAGNYTQIISRGNYVYIRDQLTTLRIFDVSNPMAPVQVSQFSSFPGSVWDIALSGNYLYAATGSSGLVVIDVSDPAQPQFVTQFGQYKDYNWLATKDNFLYATNPQGFGSTFNGVDVIDITDPTNPSVVREVAFPSSQPAPFFAQVIGNVLFVGDSDPFMTYIDISNPGIPVEISNGFIPDDYRGLDTSRGYIYLATRDDGIHIYEDPFGIVPVELSSFSAVVQNNSVALTWLTATETNNKGFEVERLRSEDNGQSENTVWQKIGFVTGNGTTTEPKSYSFNDSNVKSGSYYYRLKQIDFDGRFAYSKEAEVNVEVPDKFLLQQNYPNPFNPSTTINFSLPQEGFVTIDVYNTLGEKVSTLLSKDMSAGNYNIMWDASNFSSGIYFYRLKSHNFSMVRKMMLIK